MNVDKSKEGHPKYICTLPIKFGDMYNIYKKVKEKGIEFQKEIDENMGMMKEFMWGVIFSPRVDDFYIIIIFPC